MVSDFVNGETIVLGVIGNPICHTFSPQIHNTFANCFKQNICYLPFNVKEEELLKALRGAFALDIKGINVTVPYKKSIIKYLYDIDKQAEQIGSVNTLKYTENGYTGYNTDIDGIRYSLENENISLKNKDILIIGAGGAACPAVFLAAKNECRKIIIANRTIENAVKLKENILNFYNADIETISLNDIDDIKNCDIIIQTTTVGFGEQEGLSPIKNNDFYNKKNVEFVFDVIYKPWKTQFLKDAQKAGCKILNGFNMLFYQAVAAEEIWFERKYDENIKKQIIIELSNYFKKINNIE